MLVVIETTKNSAQCFTFMLSICVPLSFLTALQLCAPMYVAPIMGAPPTGTARTHSKSLMKGINLMSPSSTPVKDEGASVNTARRGAAVSLVSGFNRLVDTLSNSRYGTDSNASGAYQEAWVLYRPNLGQKPASDRDQEMGTMSIQPPTPHGSPPRKSSAPETAEPQIPEEEPRTSQQASSSWLPQLQWSRRSKLAQVLPQLQPAISASEVEFGTKDDRNSSGSQATSPHSNTSRLGALWRGLSGAHVDVTLNEPNGTASAPLPLATLLNSRPPLPPALAGTGPSPIQPSSPRAGSAPQQPATGMEPSTSYRPGSGPLMTLGQAASVPASPLVPRHQGPRAAPSAPQLGAESGSQELERSSDPVKGSAGKKWSAVTVEGELAAIGETQSVHGGRRCPPHINIDPTNILSGERMLPY